VIDNPLGTAPGLAFEHQEKLLVVMPGVPYEMKHLMESFVLPRMRKMTKGKKIVHRTILTQGIGESFLSEIIGDWEKDLAPDIKLAYLPSPGVVRLRLSMNGTDQEAMEQLLEEKVEKLKKLIPNYIWGEGRQTLEEVVGALLKQSGRTVSTAESCTGGYIAHRITSVPGSSAWFTGSIVAYDNRVKINQLGVKEQTLASSGAVSREVVEEMAAGVKLLLETDFAVAVSGVAGPDGGTPEKPVGTIWIALASPGGRIASRKFLFGDDRQRNILRSANAALALLYQELAE
jgi:nicotinamide-nucleotide amidase